MLAPLLPSLLILYCTVPQEVVHRSAIFFPAAFEVSGNTRVPAHVFAIPLTGARRSTIIIRPVFYRSLWRRVQTNYIQIPWLATLIHHHRKVGSPVGPLFLAKPHGGGQAHARGIKPRCGTVLSGAEAGHLSLSLTSSAPSGIVSRKGVTDHPPFSCRRPHIHGAVKYGSPLGEGHQGPKTEVAPAQTRSHHESTGMVVEAISLPVQVPVQGLAQPSWAQPFLTRLSCPLP